MKYVPVVWTPESNVRPAALSRSIQMSYGPFTPEARMSAPLNRSRTVVAPAGRYVAFRANVTEVVGGESVRALFTVYSPA